MVMSSTAHALGDSTCFRGKHYALGEAHTFVKHILNYSIYFNQSTCFKEQPCFVEVYTL